MKLRIIHINIASVIGAGLLLSFAASHLWAQEKAAADRAARPLIRVPTALTLEEARAIVEAAKAVVKADNGRAAIVAAGHGRVRRAIANQPAALSQRAQHAGRRNYNLSPADIR